MTKSIVFMVSPRNLQEIQFNFILTHDGSHLVHFKQNQVFWKTILTFSNRAAKAERLLHLACVWVSEVSHILSPVIGRRGWVWLSDLVWYLALWLVDAVESGYPALSGIGRRLPELSEPVIQKRQVYSKVGVYRIVYSQVNSTSVHGLVHRMK